MRSSISVGSVRVVLTADCNLRCRYCYQDRKHREAMTWPVLRAAIDLARRSTQRRVAFTFLGGEPLLEAPLIRRAVRYAEGLPAARRRLRFAVSTNGLLLTPRLVTFLATHRVALQLSFDGLPAMQDLRARGSFARLDRLLDDVAATHPDFFRRRLSVAVTVAVEAVPHLAASIEYLLGKDVRRIEMAPAMGQRGWRARDAGALERQFDAIAAAGRRHRHRTGRTPMALMRRRAQEKPLLPPPGEWCCGVTSGGALVVDVDGRLYPCATLAQSCQRLDASPLGRRLAALQVGHILDASLEDRWERLQGPARDARIFCRQDMKHSTGRACAGCRFLGECGVCPVASAHDPAVRSPTQVSDFLCAFSRASLSRLVS